MNQTCKNVCRVSEGGAGAGILPAGLRGLVEGKDLFVHHVVGTNMAIPPPMPPFPAPPPQTNAHETLKVSHEMRTRMGGGGV